jgi:hypothetical protein
MEGAAARSKSPCAPPPTRGASFRSAAASSGLPLAPERSAPAAWVPEGGCGSALSACLPSPTSPRLTIQAQPHGTHLLDNTLTLQERIAAGNEKIAAKAAAKIAARQAGDPTVPELPPAPEFFFFHPSKGLMENPFSSRKGAGPAPVPTQPTLEPPPRLTPPPPLKLTPTPPSTTHTPSHAALRGHYAESSIRSVRPGYPKNMSNNMGSAQQGYAQQSYPGGYQGAQQAAQGGYALPSGYGSYARE